MGKHFEMPWEAIVGQVWGISVSGGVWHLVADGRFKVKQRMIEAASIINTQSAVASLLLDEGRCLRLNG